MRQFIFWLTVATLSSSLWAQPVEVISSTESVFWVKSNRLLPVSLEVTVFKPEGEGPYPVVLIHHGKSPGNNRLQPRERAITASREFLKRGYAVVLPMRQGFSRSGGAAVGEGCNIEGNGNAQADDVRAVVSWLSQQSWADTKRMIMMGQSHGGLTTLAYAAQDPHPGVRFAVNFAGGLKYSHGCQWELALRSAYDAYGQKTKLRSLWFYGENDSYFPPSVIRPAFAAYTAAGGRAEMVAFGPFGTNAHAMFSSPAGLPIWWPKVQALLELEGLPVQVLFPELAKENDLARPAASGFAALEDVDGVPFLKTSGRAGYRHFLGLSVPRAFAVSGTGAWGWAFGVEAPLKRAIENCQKHSKEPCRLYAVDDQVVWIP